ncbi:MAG: hypothetical protein U0572_13060 [Phycisphaerales bacterium]
MRRIGAVAALAAAMMIAGCGQSIGRWPPPAAAPTSATEWEARLVGRRWHAPGEVVADFARGGSFQIGLRDGAPAGEAPPVPPDSESTFGCLGPAGTGRWSIANGSAGGFELVVGPPNDAPRRFALVWKSGEGPFDFVSLRSEECEVLLRAAKR